MAHPGISGPFTPMRTPPSRSSRENRRSASSKQSILLATVELVAEYGYSRLTMEGVAARAGVGKATLYRWWRSKGELVGEALSQYLEVGEIPDTGDTRRDLLEVVRGTVNNYSGTVAGVVIPALVADLVYYPELKDAFRRDFLEPRRAVSAAVLKRAIDRGDLPDDTDIDLVMDIWAGTVFYHTLFGAEQSSLELSEQLVDLILSSPPRGRRPKIDLTSPIADVVETDSHSASD